MHSSFCLLFSEINRGVSSLEVVADCVGGGRISLHSSSYLCPRLCFPLFVRGKSACDGATCSGCGQVKANTKKNNFDPFVALRKIIFCPARATPNSVLIVGTMEIPSARVVQNSKELQRLSFLFQKVGRARPPQGNARRAGRRLARA
jgi:hypothetical protein